MKGRYGKSDWIVDDKINLSVLCEEAGWHLATTVDRLAGEGLSHQDAEAFADFAFADEAGDGDEQDYVTDDQYERITLG